VVYLDHSGFFSFGFGELPGWAVVCSCGFAGRAADIVRVRCQEHLTLTFNSQSGCGVQLSVLLHLSKDCAQAVLPFQG
jgi:hypothetical protein